MTALSRAELDRLIRFKHAYAVAAALNFPISMHGAIGLMWLQGMVQPGKLGGPMDGKRS